MQRMRRMKGRRPEPKVTYESPFAGVCFLHVVRPFIRFIRWIRSTFFVDACRPETSRRQRCEPLVANCGASIAPLLTSFICFFELSSLVTGPFQTRLDRSA